MNAESIRQTNEKADAEVMEEAGRIGCELAEELFDTQALLEALAAQLDRLTQRGDLGQDAGGMLGRVVRMAAARVGKTGGAAVDLGHTLSVRLQGAAARVQA
jgi:hypothetical protein